MRSKRLLLLFIVLSALVACNSTSKRFYVIGNIAGMPKQKVVLEELKADDRIMILDSVWSKPDGHFELSGIAPEPGLYRLHFDSSKFILLSVDKGNLKVEANWNALENYTVEGSVGSQELRGFITAIREHLRDFNTMKIVMDSLRLKGNDSLLMTAKKDFQDRGSRFTQFVERYADTTHHLPNAIFAARLLKPETETNYLEAFTQSIGRRFPNMGMGRDFAEYRMRALTRLKQQVTKSSPIVEGEMAPDLNLPDAQGKLISLSSLRGKYVLLDFWASWCGPCRAENPNVAAAYTRFKDKNFIIYGVSLDSKKDQWEQAIKDDGLAWTQVSDLKGWTSDAAVTYAVQSIPANFLIDPKGKIVAHNLRGNQLEEMLQELLLK